MSRYSDWNNALTGISFWMKSNGFKVNENNFFVEGKLVKKFCKVQGKTGSFSECYLYVSKNFKQFTEYAKQQLTP